MVNALYCSEVPVSIPAGIRCVTHEYAVSIHTVYGGVSSSDYAVDDGTLPTMQST